jgi:hypothetical protein
MNSTREFVNRFRYAILAVLVVTTLAYGYYLYRLYVPAAPPSPAPTVNVAVMVDGSIRLDGVLYSTADKLKPKVALLEKDHPGVSFSIHAPYGADFVPVGKAVVLLQHSGAKTIWVINLPKKSQTP